MANQPSQPNNIILKSKNAGFFSFFKNFFGENSFLSLSDENNFIAYFLLFFIGIAVYRKALSFVPADPDDLILLSSVARTSNPLTYFWNDWGLKNNAYRPLHSLTIWLSYRFFGVSPVFNQLVNLILHVTTICLLYKLIRKTQKDATASFLAATLSLFSINVISPVIWVSDRPTLFVGLFFLILLNHLYNPSRLSEPNLPFVTFLSILALCSKESGLILPIFLLYYSYTSHHYTSSYRFKLTSVAVLTIILYSILRMYIFGTDAISYSESGYLLGYLKYESIASLSRPLRLFAYIENVVKNFVSPFLFIFNDSGGLSAENISNQLPVLITTLVLASLAFSKKLGQYQKIAILIMLINSLLHYSLFRHRIQYIPQLAFSFFIGSFQLAKGNINKGMVFKLLAAFLLVYNATWASRSIRETLTEKDNMLYSYDLKPILEEYPGRIDNQIYYEILSYYDK